MHAKVHLLIARSCHLPRCKNLDKKLNEIECTRDAKIGISIYLYIIIIGAVTMQMQV